MYAQNFIEEDEMRFHGTVGGRRAHGNGVVSHAHESAKPLK